MLFKKYNFLLIVYITLKVTIWKIKKIILYFINYIKKKLMTNSKTTTSISAKF